MADSEIRYIKRTGSIWDPDSLLTPGFGKAYAPRAVSGDSGVVHVVWYDNPGGDTEIYYKVFDGGWGPDVRLTETSAVSQDPHVALDASGHLHVVWRDEREGLSLLYWRWLYEGAAPGPEVASLSPVEWFSGDGLRIESLQGSGFLYGAQAWLMSPGGDSIRITDLTVETSSLIKGTIILGGAATGWRDLVVENPDGQCDTLSNAFSVLPSIWSEDERLTLDGGDSNLSLGNARCLAVDGAGVLHLVWYDNRTGQREIYYKTYDGLAWSADERVTLGPNVADDPAIAIDHDDEVHLVYEGGYHNVFYTTRTDSGWEEALLLSESDYGWSPSVTVDTAGDIFAAWNGHNGIWVRRFDGSAWGPEMQLDPPWIDRHPALAAGPDGRVHLVWQADDTISGQWLRYSEFDGVEWSPHITLETAAYLAYPSIAVDSDNNVHVSWHDKRFDGVGHLEVWYKKREGETWLASGRLTFAQGWSHRSSVAVDEEGNVYVAWTDERGGVQEIYFKHHDGTGWGASTRLTFHEAGTLNPHTLVDADGRLHLVWSDARDGNDEIYYKVRDPGVIAGVAAGDCHRGAIPGLRVVPNPVRGPAEIHFNLGDEKTVRVAFHDVRGRLVWSSGPIEPAEGFVSVLWPGEDTYGNRAAPGVYFCRVDAAGKASSAKVVMLK
jgi:hypothetical protein